MRSAKTDKKTGVKTGVKTSVKTGVKTGLKISVKTRGRRGVKTGVHTGGWTVVWRLAVLRADRVEGWCCGEPLDSTARFSRSFQPLERFQAISSGIQPLDSDSEGMAASAPGGRRRAGAHHLLNGESHVARRQVGQEGAALQGGGRGGCQVEQGRGSHGGSNSKPPRG